ncbi:basic secretory protein-like protein [Sinomicrobium oceani]|nr:basic secretory protein-like protein [Sinomicrobium oceani]
MKTLRMYLIRAFFVSGVLAGCAKADPDEPGNPDHPGSVLQETDVTDQAVMQVSLENDLGENSAEGSPKLIDNDTLTKFLVQDIGSGLTVTFEYPEPVQVAAYEITSGNDADYRDPLIWTFSGSDDGQNWATLDEQAYEAFANRYQTRRYSYINPTGYTYYRWHITRLYGGSEMFQASEFRLFSIPESEQVISPFSETDTLQQGDLTLLFVNKSEGFPVSLKEDMIGTFFTNYPLLMQDFNPDAQKTVAFRIEPSYNGVAYVFGGFATYGTSYITNNPQDTDVVTHEIMHLVQSYGGNSPSWISEGIADYVRYVYGLNNQAANWSLPAYSPNHHYTDAYRVTARFFAWLENRYEGIIRELDSQLRAAPYQDTFWQNYTGKTVDVLWQDYSQDPDL